MLQLFQKGGPVMWPLLTASLIATTLVIERIIFMTRARFRENPALRRKIFFLVESGDIEQAKAVAEKSQDPVVRMMLDGLRNKEHLQTALMTSASAELKKYSRGITVLDTIITLAPLLGLLGTVTGMIGAFGMLGGQELGAPSAITGGIAEALIATAFGLGIAITSLIPFNWLNASVDELRHQMEQSGSALEVLISKLEKEYYETSANVR